MQLTTVVVTRNKSASVKTLHTLLKLNILCLEKNVQNKITFCNDDAETRSQVFKKSLKDCDRMLWIDYSIHVDENSLRHAIAGDWNWHGVVFPCVVEGINWDILKKNIDTSEPLSQKGLDFDTRVTKRVRDDFYDVETTKPKSFCIDTKHFLKNFKKDKISQNVFADLSGTKFKLVAYTGARLVVTYPHECLGNILGAAGVTANSG